MHFFNHTVVSMSELFSIILKTFFIGPGASHSSNRISTTSITIILALFDFILYITILYLSIQMNEEFYDSQRSTIKQSLQLNSEAVQILIRTQSDLYDFMNDLAQNESWSKKLSTLQFIHRDNVMTIGKNINDSLQLFQSNSSDCFLSRQISFYTHTVSLLIYMEQIILWFFQYLTLKSFNKYSTHVVILSIIILTQSLGLIYFCHLTNISLLYLYTWIFLVRSSMTMYHYSFSDLISWKKVCTLCQFIWPLMCIVFDESERSDRKKEFMCFANLLNNVILKLPCSSDQYSSNKSVSSLDRIV